MSTSTSESGEATLEALLGPQAPVMQLTVDAFLKFQLKKKMLGADGTAPFVKQAKKLLSAAGAEELDLISAAALRGEMESHEVLRGFEEEARGNVLADLLKALGQVTKELKEVKEA
ncbi:hypothetical protein B484DRAFT_248764 [Ochromonadaceae sp. CCMP2298]|nr:hypothetical protein B484DRAFT_248764 [Ochromonadaceae sp. CCMP2298]